MELLPGEKQIVVSEEAMLGFLGLGRPHSAVWFMELTATFEKETGRRAVANPEQAIRLTYVEARDKLAGALLARSELRRVVAREAALESRDELRHVLENLEEGLAPFDFDPDTGTLPVEIAEAMIEKAAEAHYEQRYPSRTYSAQPESVKQACRDAVLPVLEAALGKEES